MPPRERAFQRNPENREPHVPHPDTAAIRARALRMAVMLRATFSQDELRLLSWAIYRSATRGTLHPRRMAVLRPILTALAVAIEPSREEDPARPRG